MTAAAGASTMCYSTDSHPSASTYCHDWRRAGLSDHSALVVDFDQPPAATTS